MTQVQNHQIVKLTLLQTTMRQRQIKMQQKVPQPQHQS